MRRNLVANLLIAPMVKFLLEGTNDTEVGHWFRLLHDRHFWSSAAEVKVGRLSVLLCQRPVFLPSASAST